MRFLLLLLFLSHLAPAQIVEQTDPLRPRGPDSLRIKAPKDSTARLQTDSSTAVRSVSVQPLLRVFRYRLSADGTFSRGNVNRDLLQLAGAFDYQLSNFFKLSSNPSFVYGRQGNILAEREVFGDFRATYRHERRLYYLAFGSVETSNLRQISRRWTYAAGAGYKLSAKKNAYLSLTNVLLREYTDFIESTDINVVRNSTRLFGEYTLGGDRFTLTHTTFYQPALGVRNVRWNVSLSLQLKLSTYLSLRTTFANAYESVVAPDRRNNDSRVTIGLVYEKK